MICKAWFIATISGMLRANRFIYILFYSLLVYMPFHIFLSQWLSTFTGGLDFWKIAKDLVLFAGILLVITLVFIKNAFKDKLFWIFLGLSVVYFLLHLVVWKSNPNVDGSSALLATAYNCRLLGYAILGWGAALLGKGRIKEKQVFTLIIIVSSVVCLLGLLQYILPKDLLTHFGYSLDRGARPAFFIDEKPDLPRIMSTLRDPNSLGAYLILPISIIVGAWLKKPKDRVLLSGLLLLHGLVLFLTFSRSAWVGSFLAVMIVLTWRYKDGAIRTIKKHWLLLLAGFIIMVAGIFSLRNEYVVQNVIFHSDENTKRTDSNNLHYDFAKQGLDGIVNRPFGHGPGTAGLVSIQTSHVVLTENYFIQVGYEVGIIGLAILVGLMAFVCRLLYRRGDFYVQMLLASFVGITFCGLLLHIWSNEAVAAQWWILTGLILGLASNKKRSKTA